MSGTYVHGYDPRESERLADQAGTLVDLLHGDTAYPAGRARARGRLRGRRADGDPGRAQPAGALHVGRHLRRVGGRGRTARRASRATPTSSSRRATCSPCPSRPPRSTTSSCASCSSTCRSRSTRSPRWARCCKPGGTITVIEGDHGSAYFHPDSAAADAAIQCQVDAAARGRRRLADRPPRLSAAGRGRLRGCVRLAADGLRGREPARSSSTASRARRSPR